MKLISFFLAATALICVVDRANAQNSINNQSIIVEGDPGVSTIDSENRRIERNSRDTKAYKQRDRSPSVELTLVRKEFGKPPLTRFFVDLTLRNPSSTPQWFIFPKTIYESNLVPKIQPVSQIAAFEERQENGMKVVSIRLDMAGKGGLSALLLASNTEIKLRNLEVGFWGDSPQKLPIEVIIADNIVIDGKSIETYLGKNRLISTSTELDVRHWQGSKTIIFDYNRDPNLTQSQLIPVKVANPKTIGLSISTLDR
jgi:hypothetical protein